MSDGEAMKRRHEIGGWRRPVNLQAAPNCPGRRNGTHGVQYRVGRVGCNLDFGDVRSDSRDRPSLRLFQRPLATGRFEHGSIARLTRGITSGDGCRLLRRRGPLTATGRLRLALFTRRVFLLAIALLFGTTGLTIATGRRFSRLDAKAKVLHRAIGTTADKMRNASEQRGRCRQPHDQDCRYVSKSAHESPIELSRFKACESIELVCLRCIR
jgi:hypothetical protein